MMNKLNLNFLDTNPLKDELARLLTKFGSEISEYGQDYFTFAVSTTETEGSILSLALYIITPEIAYDYKVINLNVKNTEELEIAYITLVTKQIEFFKVNISLGMQEVEKKLTEIFNSPLFNSSMKFLVDQANMKQQINSENLVDKIKTGEARIATLKTGEKINVGFLRVEEDEVIYYTGKGLREIFSLKLDEEGKRKAQILKELSEQELIDQGYMAKKKISEFTDIK